MWTWIKYAPLGSDGTMMFVGIFDYSDILLIANLMLLPMIGIKYLQVEDDRIITDVIHEMFTMTIQKLPLGSRKGE